MLCRYFLSFYSQEGAQENHKTIPVTDSRHKQACIRFYLGMGVGFGCFGCIFEFFLISLYHKIFPKSFLEEFQQCYSPEKKEDLSLTCYSELCYPIVFLKNL